MTLILIVTNYTYLCFLIIRVITCRIVIEGALRIGLYVLEAYLLCVRVDKGGTCMFLRLYLIIACNSGDLAFYTTLSTIERGAEIQSDKIITTGEFHIKSTPAAYTARY